MTPLAIMLVGSGIQSGLVVLLAADKWVHKVTGPTTLEGRIAAVESTITKANVRFSDKMSELTVYLEARRTYDENTRQLVAEIQGELRFIRGYRRHDS